MLYGLKIIEKKNQMLSQKLKSFQCTAEKFGDRDRWHNNKPKLLDCQRGIVTKHFR